MGSPEHTAGQTNAATSRTPGRRPRRGRLLAVAMVIALPLALALGPAEAGRLVQTRDLKNKAVTTAKIAPKAVKGSRIAPKAVNRFKLKDNAVSSAKIADGSVGAGDLAPDLRVVSSQWLAGVAGPDETLDGTNLDIARIPAPEITEEARNSDLVAVHMAFAGQVFPLPYTSFAGGKPSTISFRVAPGEIILTRMADDNVANLGFGSSLRFRYVITPSAIGGGTPPAAAAQGGGSTAR